MAGPYVTTSEILTPTVNIVSVTGNTEASLVLTAARQITIQCRTANDIYMAFTAGQVAGGGGGTPTGNYVTIKSGTSFSFPEKIHFNGTIYFSCASSVSVETITYPPRTEI